MVHLDQALIDELFAKAEASDRKRMHYDLRASDDDSSQRMLNALLPGTKVPIHRHPNSKENVLLFCGRIDEVIYEASPKSSPEGKDLVVERDGEIFVLVEKERIHLDPTIGNFGCVVPADTWHTVEVFEPSVIYEAKDGKYGEDGSVNLALRQAQKPKA